jgi:hypothetical protein
MIKLGKLKFKRIFRQRLTWVFAVIVSASSGSGWAESTINYLSFDNQNQGQGIWFEFKQQDRRDWLTQFSEPKKELARSAMRLEQAFPDYTLHWGVATSELQDMSQFGFSFSDISVYGFSGSGDTNSTIFHPYDGVDKFHFHGGLRQNYDYSGFRFDYRLSRFNKFILTQAKVNTAGLNQRTAYELGWEGKHIQLSMMQVDEDKDFAGRVYSLGMTLGRHYVSLNRLSADNKAAYTGMSFLSRTRSGKDWGIHFERRTNPLYQDANEDRITFTLGFRFNSVPRMNADETDVDSEAQTQRKNKTNAMLVGAGAVGAAVALSSGGGGGSDDRARFGSQQQTARQVLNDVNPTSIAQNREWGGYIYRNADGSFSATNAVKGTATSVLLPSPSNAAPTGAVTTASYHTHAAFDPRYDNENFSPQDILSDTLFRIDGYLATPKGQFKYHNVGNGRVVILGGPGTLATGG